MRTDLLGVFFIVGGAVAMALQTPEAPRLTIDELYADFKATGFIVYTSCLSFLMLLALLSIYAKAWLSRPATRILLSSLACVVAVGIFTDRLTIWLFGMPGAALSTLHGGGGGAGDVPPDTSDSDADAAIAESDRTQHGGGDEEQSGGGGGGGGGGGRSPPASPERERRGSGLVGAAGAAAGAALRAPGAAFGAARGAVGALAVSTQSAFGEVFEDMRKSDLYIYAACSGIFGSASVIISSLVAKVIITVVTGDEKTRMGVLKDYWNYINVVLMVLTVMVQTELLNKALALGDAMVSYPVFQAFWITFGTIGGAVLYHETGHYTRFAVSALGLFALSIALMLVGIAFLYRHPSSVRDGYVRSHGHTPTHGPRRGGGGGGGGSPTTGFRRMHSSDELATAPGGSGTGGTPKRLEYAPQGGDEKAQRLQELAAMAVASDGGGAGDAGGGDVGLDLDGGGGGDGGDDDENVGGGRSRAGSGGTPAPRARRPSPVVAPAPAPADAADMQLAAI